MKYFIVLILFVSTSLFAEKVTVNVSIPPLKGMAEAIGGAYVVVTSLMTDKSDPHVFAVSPGQISQLRKSDIVLIVGTLDFEKQMRKLRKDILDVSKGIEQQNEHWWLSTDFLKLAAVEFAEELVTKIPSKKSAIERNKQLYLDSVNQLIKEMELKTVKLENRTFYSYHGVFHYEAKRYNLTEINIEVERKTPTPREILGIIKQAKQDQVKVIFMQEQFNDRPAKMISERTGAKIVRVNPLQKDTIGLLREFTKALK